MVGAEVTELIQGYVVAMNLETTEEELMHTVFPHPTLSEMMKEAVLDAYGRVLMPGNTFCASARSSARR
jgi:dihydrolipoamide dehydrogenase